MAGNWREISDDDIQSVFAVPQRGDNAHKALQALRSKPAANQLTHDGEIHYRAWLALRITAVACDQVKYLETEDLVALIVRAVTWAGLAASPKEATTWAEDALSYGDSKGWYKGEDDAEVLGELLGSQVRISARGEQVLKESPKHIESDPEPKTLPLQAPSSDRFSAPSRESPPRRRRAGDRNAGLSVESMQQLIVDEQVEQLSCAEAGKRVGLSASAVQNLHSRKSGVGFKLNGKMYWHKRWLASAAKDKRRGGKRST